MLIGIGEVSVFNANVPPIYSKSMDSRFDLRIHDSIYLNLHVLWKQILYYNYYNYYDYSVYGSSKLIPPPLGPYRNFVRCTLPLSFSLFHLNSSCSVFLYSINFNKFRTNGKATTF